jgi:outer membrane protein assembly factor BamB
MKSIIIITQGHEFSRNGKVIQRNFNIFLILLFTLALIGCGGGSSSQLTDGNDVLNSSPPLEDLNSSQESDSIILAGTAAGGAPVIGSVTVKDSSVPPIVKTVSIKNDGQYSIQVTDMVPPLLLKAKGTVNSNPVTYLAAVSETDINEGRLKFNITPLTNLIFANLAQKAPEIFFDRYNPDIDAGSVTSDELDNIQKNIKKRLSQVMMNLGVDKNTDLLRVPFSTDHTGLDAMLDILRIEPEYDENGNKTSRINITNIATGSKIIDDLKIADDSNMMSMPEKNYSKDVKAIYQIKEILEQFTNLFAEKIPRRENQVFRRYFDNDFLDSAKNKDTFISLLCGLPSSFTGLQFTDLSIIDSSKIDNGRLIISLSLKKDNKILKRWQNWHLNHNGENWIFRGDQESDPGIFVDLSPSYILSGINYTIDICEGGSNPGCPPGKKTAAWPGLHNDVRHTGRTSATGPETPEIKWTFYIGKLSGSYHGVAIGADNIIYTGASEPNSLYALNHDGTEKWQYEMGSEDYHYPAGTPAIGKDGTIYVPRLKPGNLLAITPDGELDWMYTPARGSGYWMASSPTIDTDGTVYIPDFNNNPRGALSAVNPDGSLKWYYAIAETGYERDPVSAIAIDDKKGHLYFGASNKHLDYGDFRLLALNREGELLWDFETIGPVYAAPAIGEDGTVYVGSRNGEFYAVSPEGDLKWQYSTGPVTGAAVIASDGTIIVGDHDSNIYAFSQDGQLKWQYETDGLIGDTLAVDGNDTIYAGCNDTYLYSISISGQKNWMVKTNGRITGAPAIGSDGRIYITSYDGYLYSIGEKE